MNDHDYAVVVGINHYPNPPLKDLHGPENDATGFREWLVSPTGGSVPDDGDHIHLILSRNFTDTGSPSYAKPTTVEVDGAFREIQRHVDLHPPGRRLYMFFAGHGIAPRIEMNDSLLLMANAGEDAMGNNIPGQMYAQSLRAGARFEDIALFMDCCRDNYLRATVHNPTWDISQGKMDARNVRVFTAFATKWSLKSREKEIEPGRWEGIFTRAVLTALRSGRITGSELHDVAINNVKTLLKEDEYQQPEIRPDPNGDIVFSEAAPPASGVKVTVSFTTQILGHRVELCDGALKPMCDHQATVEPWELPLKRGLYLVRDAETSREHVFQVPGGGVVDVQF